MVGSGMKETKVRTRTKPIKRTPKAFQTVQTELLQPRCCDALEGGFVTPNTASAGDQRTQQARRRDGDVLILTLNVTGTGLPGELYLRAPMFGLPLVSDCE